MFSRFSLGSIILIKNKTSTIKLLWLVRPPVSVVKSLYWLTFVLKSLFKFYQACIFMSYHTRPYLQHNTLFDKLYHILQEKYFLLDAAVDREHQLESVVITVPKQDQGTR